MSTRSASLQSGTFNWVDATSVEIPHGSIGEIDLLAINTNFASSNPLHWNGSQPNGSAVTSVSGAQLLLTVPNALEEPADKSYQFSVVAAMRSQQTPTLTILLKGNPGAA
jgi:hypothetical protein